MRDFDPSHTATETTNQTCGLHDHSGYALFTDPENPEGYKVGRALTRKEMELFDDIDRRHGTGSENDCFMSINGFEKVRTNYKGTAREHDVFRAADQYVSHLTAVWVDIDCHREGLAVGDVVSVVESLVSSGALPRPSAELLSGRGVWYLWYIRDPLTGRAVDATPQAKQQVVKLNTILVDAFRKIGGDDSATNVGRWMRAPNSFNTKAGKRVALKVTTTDTGPLTYHLTELEQALSGRSFRKIPTTIANHLKARNLWPSDREAKPLPLKRESAADQAKRGKARQQTGAIDPVKSANGRAGRVSRFERLKTIVEFIAEERGGIPVGQRANSILYYATALRFLKWNLIDIQKAAHSLPLQQPEDDPFTPDEIERAIRSAFDKKRQAYHAVRYETMGKLYDLTEKERATLYRRHSITLPLPGETKRDAADAVRQLTGRPFKIQTLRNILAEYGPSPDNRPADEQIRQILNTRLSSEGETQVGRSTFYEYKKEVYGFESVDTEAAAVASPLPL